MFYIQKLKNHVNNLLMGNRFSIRDMEVYFYQKKKLSFEDDENKNYKLKVYAERL